MEKLKRLKELKLQQKDIEKQYEVLGKHSMEVYDELKEIRRQLTLSSGILQKLQWKFCYHKSTNYKEQFHLELIDYKDNEYYNEYCELVGFEGNHCYEKLSGTVNTGYNDGEITLTFNDSEDGEKFIREQKLNVDYSELDKLIDNIENKRMILLKLKREVIK